jgi:MFS family permease
MSTPIISESRPHSFTSSFHPLTQKNFALFWGGAFISSLGFWIQSIGQGWQVLQLTNSALLLGLVIFASTVPNIVFSMFGGVIADRFNRRRLLLCTQTLFLLIAFSQGLLTTLHIITVWHIIVMALASGIVNTVGIPAWQAFIGDLLPPKELKQGIALNSVQFNMSRVVGPAVGGLSVGLLGIAGSYYLNAASYVAVIIPLLLMRPLFRRQTNKELSLWSSLGDGLKCVRRHPSLQILLLLQLVIAFLVFPYQTLLPIFADRIFHIGATGLGILNSAAGIGAMIGSVLIVMLVQRIRSGYRMLLLLCCVGGGACVAFALTEDMGFSLALLLLLGICTVVSTTLTNTSVQTAVPEEMRARVLSIWVLVVFGLAPFGNLCAGWVAQAIGAPLTLEVSGVLCILSALLVVGVRKMIPAPVRA